MGKFVAGREKIGGRKAGTGNVNSSKDSWKFRARVHDAIAEPLSALLSSAPVPFQSPTSILNESVRNAVVINGRPV
jgi:hypothetical protein